MIRGSTTDLALSTNDPDTRNSCSTEAYSETDYEERLEASLEILDFQRKLPKKTTQTLRMFYNNCNGVEINKMIHAHLKACRDKVKYDYINDVDVPTKLDGLLR